MYKIIQNNSIVDVVKYPKFIRFLPSGHIAMTEKTSAQGIIGSDDKTIYSFIDSDKNYVKTTIAEIPTESEFMRLQSLINSDQVVSADENALAKAKREKIHKLSTLCKSKITSGFSITLTDGNIYNFRLTVEDQLNLMLIEAQLNSGAESFIYHATDKPCQIYQKEDMLKIIKAFRAHILYHTTYFNSAKQYIKTLTNIEEVNLFTYGFDVSNYTENLVLRQLLKNGGNT